MDFLLIIPALFSKFSLLGFIDKPSILSTESADLGQFAYKFFLSFYN